jgi:limonene-1,2-epoxide hydrolase
VDVAEAAGLSAACRQAPTLDESVEILWHPPPPHAHPIEQPDAAPLATASLLFASRLRKYGASIRSSSWGVSTMQSPAKIVERFIDSFVDAWPRADAAKVSAYFADDAIYHNIPMEPSVGRAAIESTFTQFMAMGGRVSVELLHLLSNDSIVMTERIDHFVGEDRTISLPMMGICEVHDGLITVWRDYFDLNHLGA